MSFHHRAAGIFVAIIIAFQTDHNLHHGIEELDPCKIAGMHPKKHRFPIRFQNRFPLMNLAIEFLDLFTLGHEILLGREDGGHVRETDPRSGSDGFKSKALLTAPHRGHDGATPGKFRDQCIKTCFFQNNKRIHNR